MAKKKAVKRPSVKKPTKSKPKKTPSKTAGRPAVIRIVHEDVAGYRCPVCKSTVLFSENVSPCDHVLHIVLDLVGDPFFERKRSPKGARPITFAVADNAGPHGGTMTLVFDLQGVAGDPKELYWLANKDQKEFLEALEKDNLTAKKEADEREARPEAVRRKQLVSKLWKMASEEGFFIYEGQLELERVAAGARQEFLGDVAELLVLTLETGALAPSDYEVTGVIERIGKEWAMAPLPHHATFALAGCAARKNDLAQTATLLEGSGLDASNPLTALDERSIMILRRLHTNVMGFRVTANRLWPGLAPALDQAEGRP